MCSDAPCKMSKSCMHTAEYTRLAVPCCPLGTSSVCLRITCFASILSLCCSCGSYLRVWLGMPLRNRLSLMHLQVSLGPLHMLAAAIEVIRQSYAFCNFSKTCLLSVLISSCYNGACCTTVKTNLLLQFYTLLNLAALNMLCL